MKLTFCCVWFTMSIAALAICIGKFTMVESGEYFVLLVLAILGFGCGLAGFIEMIFERIKKGK